VVAPIPLTPEQRKELRRQARRAVGRVCERIHFVLLFTRGHSVTEIAQLYEVDDRTVEIWLERYRRAGVPGLSDLPRSGRPRLASAAAQAEASRCLDGDPEATGAERTTWTRRLLGRHLGERFGLWLSRRSLGRLIGSLGFVWRRPKLTVKPVAGEEAARAASRAIIAVAARLYPQSPLLFGDECDLHQLPVVRGGYQRRGQQRAIPTPGTNAKQGVFGFLDIRTGEWHYFLKERKRSKEFIECLHELDRHYGGGPLLLFVDNASIHHSDLTCRWLEHHPNLVLIYLPSYSGHKCNPVEKVWWALKENCAANQLYASLEAVQDAIQGFFSQFSREAARRLTAGYWQPIQELVDLATGQPDELPLAA
jgi:transposase